MITVKMGSKTQAGYSYNNNGRIATSSSASYTYDVFGARVIEAVTGGATTQFLFGPKGALLAEANAQGQVQRSYIYLDGAPLAQIDSIGSVAYVLADQVGQPQKMLSALGALDWDRIAGIFGDTVAQPVGASTDNPLRFPGQQYDALTGLHYNYFRDYDPSLGRYIESDPIGLRGGPNTYAYAGANPVRWFDTYGLDMAIIENGSTEGNPIGHTAFSASNSGIYSYGNSTPAGSSVGDYIQREAPRRDSDVYTMKTTPEQDAKALEYLKNKYGDDTSLHGGLWQSLFGDNCATRTNAALDAAGVPDLHWIDPASGADISPPHWLPGSAGLRALENGATQIHIPQGSTTVPPELQQFEPAR